MEPQESALVWEELEMDALARDFDRLFPSYSFDAKAVLADIMTGQLWEAVKKLCGGISGAVLFQREEFRVLFFTILVLGVAAALFSGFADLFRDHQVSDLAFYFVYLLLIAVLGGGERDFKRRCDLCQTVCSDLYAGCRHIFRTCFGDGVLSAPFGGSLPD